MPPVISIDLSSKPGFAIWHQKDVDSFNGEGGDWRLDSYGTVFCSKGVKDFGEYPMNFIKHAEYIIESLMKTLSPHIGLNPEHVTFVVEETTASKNNYSQKTLEYLHLILNKRLAEGRGNVVHYIRTGVWKRAVGATQNAEERKHNEKVRKIKRKTGSNVAKDENGKRIGKLTKKHYSVRAANNLFGLELNLKMNDAADAILLGHAYLSNDLPICDGTVKGGLNANQI